MAAAGPTVVVVDAGDAWFEAGDQARGTVSGVFGRAAYLRFGERVLALCRPDVPSGPLHLRTRPFPALARGDPACLSGGRLEVGPFRVDVADGHRWTPRPIPHGALRRRNAATGPPGPETGLPPDLVASAARLVEGDDLDGLAHLVGGRGPGLTPAGDDLLAGVLVAHAAVHPAAEAEGRRRAAAAAARTNDVATAFLRWAARGQCIQPVHDLLAAIAVSHTDGETTARARLGRVGATSGAALLLGIDLVVETEDQR